MPILNEQDFVNAKRDIRDIGESVNLEKIIKPRWGKSFKSLPLVSKDWSNKLTEFQNAINAAAEAGAGANGWTDLLVKTWSGRPQSEINKENKSIFDYGGTASQDRLSSRFTSLAEAQIVYSEAKTLDDTLDLVAAKQSLIDNGYVYMPSGEYWFNRELMLSDNNKIFGDGRDVTIINQTDDCARDQCCITNEQNIRSQDNTYNHNISISDLTVDGRNDTRFPNMIGGGIASAGGSGISFASVKGGFIENVHVINPAKHGIDICASVYVIQGDEVYPKNPSSNIRIINCETERFGDDGITTHFSYDIEIYGCYAHHAGMHYTYANSNGFEIDDGSYDVKIFGGYVFDCTKGVQVKGHSNVPSATRVSVIGVTAENCNRAFELRHEGHEGEGTTYSPTAYDVSIINCTAINPCARVNTTLNPRAIRITAYSGVSVENFTVVGYTSPTVNPTDEDRAEASEEDEESSTTSLVVAQSKCRNVTFKNIKLYKIKKASALVHVGANTKNAIVDGVYAEDCEGKIVLFTASAEGSIHNIWGYTESPTNAECAIHLKGSMIRQAYDFSRINITGDYQNLIISGSNTPRYINTAFDFHSTRTMFYTEKNIEAPLVIRRDVAGRTLDIQNGYDNLVGSIDTSSLNTIFGSWNQNDLCIQAMSDEGVAYRWKINYLTGSFYPNQSAVWSIGSANRLIKDIYATNGTILTSDANYKEQITDLSDKEKAVAQSLQKLIKKFKLKTSVAEKGSNARWHIGVIAQEVIKAFKDQELDAFEYGVVCYDEWREKQEIIEDGEIVEQAEEAGSRYAIRYDELAMFILSSI